MDDAAPDARKTATSGKSKDIGGIDGEKWQSFEANQQSSNPAIDRLLIV